MNEVVKQVHSRIRSLKPYTVREVGDDIIKMDKNENPYDLPESLKREITEAAAKRSWSRYPPIVASELHEKIARYTGWIPEGVIAGNGSDEMILMILMSFLGEGKRLVVPTPSFPMFTYIATLIGATVVQVPLNDDFSYNPDALSDAFLDGGDLLVICSPNNPTGGLFPLDRLEDILERTTAPVIMDEAYYEFSRVTALSLVEKYPNLIIFRTFSKAFSLAGQRIGYGLMSPELAVEIGKVKLPFNIDVFSITAAMRLLENTGILGETIEGIIRERDRLIRSMNQIEDVTVYPTASNFILFRTPYESTSVCDDILRDGILIRDLSANPALRGTLRVTTSRPSDNDRFLGSLSRIMNERGRG